MEISSFFDSIPNAKELTKFVSDNVQPSRDTVTFLNKAVDETSRFLQSHRDMCGDEAREFPWSFKRIFKSGSLTKGTAVRGHVDVDLVCFVEKQGGRLSNPQDFLEKREQIIRCVMDKFGFYYCWNKVGDYWTRKTNAVPLAQLRDKTFIPLYNYHNEYLLNLKLVPCSHSRGVKMEYEVPDEDSEKAEDVIDVDIIPAFDLYAYCGVAPERRDGAPVFSYFHKQEHSMRFADHFSASLAELQKDFLGDKLNITNNNNLKKLMLLVKFWFKTEVKPRYNRVRFPSYLLELLCLYTYEKKLAGTKYDMLVWFNQVLEVLIDKEKLSYVWEKNYKTAEVPWEVMEQRPLIVDPANPYNNVAGGIAQWPEVYACAVKFQELLRQKYSGKLGLPANCENVVVAREAVLPQVLPAYSEVGCELMDRQLVPVQRERLVRPYDPIVGQFVSPACHCEGRSSETGDRESDQGGGDAGISTALSYVAVGGVSAAVTAGICYMIAKNKEEEEKGKKS